MATRSATWSDRLLDAAVWTAPIAIACPFLWMLGDVVVRGVYAFAATTDDASGFVGTFEFLGNVATFLVAEPDRAGRSGGIGPILVSTGLLLIVCMVVAFPLGLGTAILLSEFVADRSRFGSLVRRSLDVLAGAPSIVFGLFGNALFCRFFGLKFSILSGGLTLACMALPLVIRAAEESLRAVPDAQRHAAAAAGLSRRATIFRVLLPQAAPGVVVALILGTGRAAAETAALIFTSGYVDRMPTSLFDSGRSLSVHIYDLSMNVPGGNANAYATALVLLAILVTLNVAARRLTVRFLRTDAESA